MADGVPSVAAPTTRHARARMKIIVDVGRLWLARHWRSFVPATSRSRCASALRSSRSPARVARSRPTPFLEHVHSSTVSVSTLGPYTDETNDAIAAIPEVCQSRTYVGFSLFPLVDGRPDFAQAFEAAGSFDGRYFDQDRFTPTEGRMADPEPARRGGHQRVRSRAARLSRRATARPRCVLRPTQIDSPVFFAAPPPPCAGGIGDAGRDRCLPRRDPAGRRRPHARDSSSRRR